MSLKKNLLELLDDIATQVKYNTEETSRKPLMITAAALALVIAVCVIFGVFASDGSGHTHPVYINEVLASNTRYPNGDGVCCDYVELYNGAGYVVDLSGFCLSDGGNSTRYEFPSGTVIGPHEYLVVYCDKLAESQDYARFGISRGGGEQIHLINSNGAVSDSVLTVSTGLNEAMIRKDDGSWGLSVQATPGQKNNETALEGQALHNPDISPVRISEFMSDNSGFANGEGLFCDWVELHNTSGEPVDISGFTLSDSVSVDKFVFPAGTVLEADAYLVVNCTMDVEGEMIAPFGLSQLGEESVVFKNHEGKIVDIVDSTPMDTNQSMALGSDDVWSVTRESTPGFENSSAGYEAYLQKLGVGIQNVIISELMTAGQTLLADASGQFPDWVELQNISDETVNLKGWFLSDNPEKPTKWRFPEVLLAPGQRLVVYCSGQDSAQEGQLDTNFSLATTGESLVLSSPLGVSVHAVSFGKGEEDCSFIFDVEAKEIISTDYPTPGYSNDMDGYEQFCMSNEAKGPLAIWELMASNDWYLPQALGKCYDWVEIRNISEEDVKLSDYSITDDPDAPGQYVLPEKTLGPGESIAVILSGDQSLTNQRYDHANFTISVKKDSLFLFGTDGDLVDFVRFRDIPLGYSYGRTGSVGGFYYMKPTPKKDNDSGSRLISQMPRASVESGVYVQTSGVDVTMESDGAIYYTTDGSDPGPSSKRYDGPIHIEKTTVLRAVAVEDGKLQSGVYTSTFIFEDSHSLPVVSLVTDPDNLWSADGIYKSTYDIKELKKPANISYSGSDGTFALDCEISMHGMTSILKQDKKSFTVRFRDNYDGALNYDIFEDGQITWFSSILLRADQEDVFSTYIRDNLYGNLAYDYCDTLISMRNKYVILYLNGEYWGIYSIREHHSEEHYASHMEVPLDSVTMVKSYATAETAMHPVYLYCQKTDFSKQENYEELKTILDVTSFADWIIIQAYCGNFDIHGNMRYYYSSADGLWRCGLVDVDLGMFRGAHCFEDLRSILHHKVFVRALYSNEEFQDLLARRLAELLAGPLSDEAVNSKIEEMADMVRPELAMEKDRWGGTIPQWERMITRLHNFTNGRSKEMIDSLCNTLNFTQEEREHYFGELLARMK